MDSLGQKEITGGSLDHSKLMTFRSFLDLIPKFFFFFNFQQPINKNEVIYVQQQSQINTNLPQNQKFVVNSTTTAQSQQQQQSQQTTNQNIILVKPKFLQQTAN